MIARTVARMPNSNVNFVFKSMVIGALLAGKEAEYLYENAITHALIQRDHEPVIHISRVREGAGGQQESSTA